MSSPMVTWPISSFLYSQKPQRPPVYQEPVPKANKMARSLFIIRLVQTFPGLEGYDAMLANYWSAVKAQVERHAMTSGPVKQIFIETVPGRGEDAIVQLQQMNPQAATFVRGLVANGATIEELEDSELLAELIDWGQCASQNLMSNKVRNVVQTGQVEAAGMRDDHLRRRLNDTIQDEDVAVVLAVSPQLPIPDRIERFIVSLPELDQLERWLRTKMEEVRREMMEQAQRQASGETADGQSSSGGLWTPG